MADTLTLVPITGKLDVIETYNELMEASTGPRSGYIRAKETLEDLLVKGMIKDADKAAVVSKTIAEIATNVTTSAMSAAIEIARENRDAQYKLTKSYYEIDLLKQQVANAKEDVNSKQAATNYTVMQGWKLQGELYREYGVNTTSLVLAEPIMAAIGTNGDPITSMSALYKDYGIKYETIQKATVDTYATYANSYKTHGKIDYVIEQNGANKGQFASVSSDGTGLTHAQTRVAERQTQGFDDNQRQHVANSSASMLGLMISSDSIEVDIKPYLRSWMSSIDYLNTSHMLQDYDIDVRVYGTASVSDGHMFSGTVTNIEAGKELLVKYTVILQPETETVDADGNVVTAKSFTGATAIVRENGTFTSTLSEGAPLLSGAKYVVTTYIKDNAGVVVNDTFDIVATD